MGFALPLNGIPIGVHLSIYRSGRLLPNEVKSIYAQLAKGEINIRKITPHGLRHTHVMILIMNGLPPKTVADRLGNTRND
ncbi:tyrosine-type recombinase/integrase [Siminovitchia terrae]|uniref:tyrosine-type recombinase/integrase n=1 Tax=Siminovitchia terrae TaxID=1914933 RepID=UPI001BB365B8|nr:tyrosine-type recombinase/integrase [Siminovitchia terrae]